MKTHDHFNPFPGLRSFEEEEEYLFFGRERQVDQLLNKLKRTHFLAVIGASGSGKSSLVKSGLLPSLHSGYLTGEGHGWRIGVFRPGDDPIGNLTAALTSEAIMYDAEPEEADQNQAIVNTTLRRSESGITNVVKQFLPDAVENILIVVDQFEELFRFSQYEKRSYKGTRDAVTFINLLLHATTQIEKPIYVVFTMRSDFLGECTEFRGLPEAINKGQYLIPRMTREERKMAITGPIAVGGANITPRLLSTLLNDLGDNHDQLPILQHALMRTWDRWYTAEENKEVPIDLKHYNAIGRLEKALSLHADEAYEELSTDVERKRCERMFKALTTKSSGLKGIRRPTKVHELMELCECSEAEIIKIVEVFRKPGRSFLMPPVGVEIDQETVIDISHESLMRVWNRLIEWVEEESTSAEIYLRLADAAALYQEGKTGLWRDPDLQIALQWKNEKNPNATWAQKYDPGFERAMAFLRYSEERAVFLQKQKEEKAKRRRRGILLTAVFLGVGLLGMGILAFLAWKQSEDLEIAKIKLENDKIKLEDSEESLTIKNKVLENQRDSIDKLSKTLVDALKLSETRLNNIKGLKEGLEKETTKLNAALEALTEKDIANRKLSDSILVNYKVAERVRLQFETMRILSMDYGDLEDHLIQEKAADIYWAYKVRQELLPGQMENQDIFNSLSAVLRKADKDKYNQFTGVSPARTSNIDDENKVWVVGDMQKNVIELNSAMKKQHTLTILENAQIREFDVLEKTMIAGTLDGKLVRILATGDTIVQQAHFGKVTGLDLLTPQTFLSVGADGYMILGDVKDVTKQTRIQLASGKRRINDLALNADNTIAICSDSEGGIYLVSIDLVGMSLAVNSFRIPYKITCIDMGGNDGYAYFGTLDGRVGRLELSTENVVLLQQKHTARTLDVCVYKSDEYHFLATSSADHSVNFYNLSNTYMVNGEMKATGFYSFLEHEEAVWDIDFTSDKKAISTSTTEAHKHIPFIPDMFRELEGILNNDLKKKQEDKIQESLKFLKDDQQ